MDFISDSYETDRSVVWTSLWSVTIFENDCCQNWAIVFTKKNKQHFQKIHRMYLWIQQWKSFFAQETKVTMHMKLDCSILLISRLANKSIFTDVYVNLWTQQDSIETNFQNYFRKVNVFRSAWKCDTCHFFLTSCVSMEKEGSKEKAIATINESPDSVL